MDKGETWNLWHFKFRQKCRCKNVRNHPAWKRNLKVSSRKSKQSVYVYVVPTQHKKRIKLNANPLMQYARIDTALQPLHTCFFLALFFTHVFSSVLMFQIRYENHGLPISWVRQKMSSEEFKKSFHLHIWATALNPIPTGCCPVILIYGLIGPSAGRNRVYFTLCILAEDRYYSS